MYHVAIFLSITFKPVRLTIPEGTQTGKVLRVKGEGFKNVHGHGKGDLLIHVHVETPVKLSSKQKSLLEQFQETKSESNSPERKSFLDKLKVFLGGAFNFNPLKKLLKLLQPMLKG